MFSSIRSRLTLWYIVGLAVVISAFSLLTYTLLVRALEQQTDRNITEIARNVTGSVQGEQEDPEAGQRSAEEAITEAFDEFHSLDYSFVVTRPDGSTMIDTSGKASELKQSAEGFTTQRLGGRPFRIGRSELLVGGTKYNLFVVYSLAEQHELEETVRDIFLASILVTLLSAAVGGYFLAGRSLAPIGQMSRRAAAITAENVHERLPVKNPNDEIGSLAATVNELLDRLANEFDRQRRFVTDASHELRTPLAVIRGEADVALLNDQRPATEYRDSLRVVRQESQRLSAIVEDLFTLARADSGKLAPDFKDVYVDELVAECVRAVRTLADKRYLGITLESHELRIRGDEQMLHRLFMNLLDNAIKYNYYGGSVRIVIDESSVRVGSTGNPIAPEQAEVIFERFYRGDKARSVDGDSLTSGAGLGLSIAKVIAKIHNAKLEYAHIGIENVFSVTFPKISYIRNDTQDLT